MNAAAVLPVVLLCAAAAALALPEDARARLTAVAGSATAGEGPRAGPRAAAGPGRAARRPSLLAASVVGGAGVGLLVGGPFGVLLGVLAGAGSFTVLCRLEPGAVRERRERLSADLPVAVDLLGACLVAGRPPTDAMRAVAFALGGPLAAELGPVLVRLELGADPAGVWREVGAQAGPLAALGRTMARSLETGAPMADGLGLLAVDLRRRQRATAEQRARSVGVRAAAPLGLCFLPAFVLIGIVPSIVGAFASISWW